MSKIIHKVVIVFLLGLAQSAMAQNPGFFPTIQSWKKNPQ